ncbi:hypothetical protein ASF18_16790 [Methylobacterium sp. Leaf89]|nr:hypothetical protein ASF18_16790 [Methylobacterium sp. Leaf89]
MPAHVSFAGYHYIPLDIKMLTESDLAFLTGDGFKAALILLAKSWQETPATSLPDDNRLLANLAGFGKGPAAMSEWEKVREEALSDFVLCSDGRLYSQSLQARALEAWENTLKRQAQTKKGREKIEAMRAKQKADKEAAPTLASVTDTVTASVIDTATERKEEDITGHDIIADHMEGQEVDVPASPAMLAEVTSSPKPRRRALNKFNGRSLDLDVSQVTGLADEFAFLPDIMKDLGEIDIELDREKIAPRDRPNRLREKLKGRNSQEIKVPF